MGYTENTITDAMGRSFKTLRLSLTPFCNLSCVYCVAPGAEIQAAKTPVKSADEIVEMVASIHQLTGLKEVRLTGGEPTLYKELPRLIYLLRAIGIPKISMTSNGYLLLPMLEELVKAGLNNINISLDAIDENVFFKITKRRNLGRVLQAIHTASALGVKVKINTVAMQGINDHQIVPLFLFGKRYNYSVRFLELMKMGHLNTDSFHPHFYPQQSILDSLADLGKLVQLPRTTGSTATYWKDDDGYEFGIIANESAPFCQDCDRLRLDTEGNIYGCLSSNVPVNINEEIHNSNQLSQKLAEALSAKQLYNFKGSSLSMMHIGG